MNTQYRKNLKAVLEASKSYCDKRIDDLEWQIGTYNYDVATDSNVARIKTLPSNTYKSQVDYIGGKSVKYNQLITSEYETIAVGDYGWSTASSQMTITNSHKYLIVSDNNELSVRLRNSSISYVGGTLNLTTQIYTFNDTTDNRYFFQINGTSTKETHFEFIDLTDIFGAGNEPSDVATAIPLLKANGYKLDGTDEYSTGDLKHAITTSVVYSGTDVQDITLSIPSEVLADSRYGLGFDNTNYNHLDSDGHLRGNVVKEEMKTFNWSYDSSFDTYAYIIDFSVANAKCLAVLPSPFENVLINNSGNLLLTFASGSFANIVQLKQALSGVYLIYQSSSSFDQDYSQYFTDGWNKVDLNNQYATVEMVCDEPIDMPNSITNLIKEVKA